MRFSAVVVAAMASHATAWSPHRFAGSWGWGNYGGGWGSVVVPTNAPTGAPIVTTTVAAAVPNVVETTVVVEENAVRPTSTKQAGTTTTQAPAATTTAASSGGSSGSLSSDQQGALDAHNAARAEVGNADLVWDATLAAHAQEWADNLAATGSFEHSQTSGEGENLYMESGKTGSSPNTNAANAWLGEKSLYNGETITSSNYMSFGHYTQAVWKSTTKIGIAVASGSSGTYVVARYSPPGNYIGEKPY